MNSLILNSQRQGQRAKALEGTGTRGPVQNAVKRCAALAERRQKPVKMLREVMQQGAA